MHRSQMAYTIWSICMILSAGISIRHDFRRKCYIQSACVYGLA